jgi:hypothetical protein
MYLINFGLNCLILNFSNLVVRIKFFEQNIGNIFFFWGSFNEANIINIYHYTIWWSPNQTFFLNFESPNGHLLILNFSDSFICESTFISKNIFSLWSSYAKLEWLNKTLKGGKKGFNVENIFIGTTFNNNRFARMCEPILIFQTLLVLVFGNFYSFGVCPS